MSLAPIVLFVYNRIDHTKSTISALANNELAQQSDLYIFSDAAKYEKDTGKVIEVRNYIKSIDGFNSIKIIEREINLGLAKSIIDGVTEVIDKYGKVIVLEDDIVTSPYFLKFMNSALDTYLYSQEVWHISGWNYPVALNKEKDVYFWRVMNCWGWATWKNRWDAFRKDPERIISDWSDQQKYDFDLEGTSAFWPQIIDNKLGKINTWAVFWYATIFEADGLCLNPAISYVDNIGRDGSGVNCGNSTDSIIKAKNPILNSTYKINWDFCFREDEDFVLAVKKYYKSRRKNIFYRIVNKISRILTGKNFI
ncbi:glycosyl transferase [Marinobacterium zhoushanense]|uniref:Glycosyl transferase n=1 Tax=Marinobacterium zhoushanense TaxID=1679163 RepID=A0ABQ1KUN4_9GAMM|nr:glycosyltransferase family 2 protein [Marinobacterium zhoushanense]GGC06865.1 glycosyl transferase [Marinobacterium zhoushanense]